MCLFTHPCDTQALQVQCNLEWCYIFDSSLDCLKMIDCIAFTVAVLSSLSQLGCLAGGESWHYSQKRSTNFFLPSVLSLEKDSVANVELQNGMDRCQGLVKIQGPVVNTSWQACSSTVGESEAVVICRQIGCNISHARTVEPTQWEY